MKVASEILIKGWSYKQSTEDNWRLVAPEKSITEIHPDLVANGEIPDPLIDDNEKKVQWVADKDWEYKASFTVPEALLGSRVHEFVFEGLDTYADIFVNGTKVLSTENMFVTYKVDVTKYLSGGENELRIYFTSALLEGRRRQDKYGKYIASNGEMSRTHVRKAQYQYGWDWGPLLLTCGPYRPVKLISYEAYISDVFVKGIVNDDLSVDIDVQAEVSTIEEIELEVEIISPKNSLEKTFTTKVPSSGTFSNKYSIQSPTLWYPFSHGDPSMYTFNVSLLKENQPVHSVTKTVGFKKVEIVQEPLEDQPGSSFYFKVNNVPVYASGSNWIPSHSFQTCLSDQDYKDWMRIMVNGNQNMIRIWGGGYFERDIFYDECDKLGILVWHDMMHACGQYPGYPEFIESVTQEITSQFIRLRNHASIALICGNNEDYEFAERHDLEWNKDDLSGDYTHTTFPARTLYEGVFPRLVKELAPFWPYHPGTPYGGSGTTDKTAGDIHQWNVWHGKHEKYQLWYTLGGRFVSEFGMEGAPVRKTFDQFITDPKQRYPQSYLVDHHNKCEFFERKLALYVVENIKLEGYDLDSWIYATQLMQAECLGYAYRCWRREWKGENKRYSGGTIVWQINDCWPCTSWGLVDHYKRPKLAYYSVKRESQLLGIGIYRHETRGKSEWRDRVLKKTAPFDYSTVHNHLDIWGVNLGVEDVKAKLHVDLYNVTSGAKLESFPVKDIILKANQTTSYYEKIEIPTDQPVVAHGKIVSLDGQVISSAGDWPQPLKYLMFPGREVKVVISDNKVTVSTNKPIKGFTITIAHKELEIEDNGFDVFPDGEKIITIPGLSSTDDVTYRYYDQSTKY